MYFYKFIGNSKKPSETQVCTDCPDGFIMFGNGDPVDWTKFDNVDGVLIDIPVIPTPEPTPLTESEIKQQKYAEINMTYSMKLRQISNARVLADNSGLATDTLVALYKAMQAELKSKILEVYNDVQE